MWGDAKMFNEQLRTDNKGKPPGFGFGRSANNLSL
jgi:hypothetical protein